MNNKLKMIMAAGLISVTTLAMVGCEEIPELENTGSEKSVNQKQEEVLNESNKKLGMPSIKNHFEKGMAKDIWELRDNPDLITYAYTQNMDGKYVYLGKCVGYGLPYTTQYTSPEKMHTVDGGEYGAENPYTLPQADPNGLYSSETTNATWLMLLNEETGEREIIYSEPSMVVTQTKLPARLVADWSLPANY